MNSAAAVRQQLGFWHGALDQVIADCSAADVNKSLPNATISSIASIYAHTMIAEDVFVHVRLQEQPAIFESEGWEARTGVPFPGMPPTMTPAWASAVQMDLPVFREYAKKVETAVDAYLAGVSDAELERTVQTNLGEQTVEWYIVLILGTHLPQHTGEIAALKGVQGLKGLPF